jgi:magnesium-dependent phosphatase-1
MSDNQSTVISLVVFDGDDTLWYGLDSGYISGETYSDPGRDDYTFHPLDELHIQRNDGQRFRLYPEVPALLPELVRRNVLISLASYNQRAPVLNALRAFEIDHFFQHPVVEWNSRKDRMLKAIIRKFIQDNYLVSPHSTLFIDDDHRGSYRRQMASIGVHFLQKGVDIVNLTDLLDHPRYSLMPVQKSLI